MELFYRSFGGCSALLLSLCDTKCKSFLCLNNPNYSLCSLVSPVVILMTHMVSANLHVCFLGLEFFDLFDGFPESRCGLDTLFITFLCSLWSVRIKIKPYVGSFSCLQMVKSSSRPCWDTLLHVCLSEWSIRSLSPWLLELGELIARAKTSPEAHDESMGMSKNWIRHIQTRSITYKMQVQLHVSHAVLLVRLRLHPSLSFWSCCMPSFCLKNSHISQVFCFMSRNQLK